ncbi:GNAT family N-acetyltransferase [Amycolatopsis minnesotensis]|uniref:GNAT family N-acetyltransferase n=1 Tax=Amycolatopsis minnesotensis TaxID=337894 RepID=A0ABN2QV51_9PSEU
MSTAHERDGLPRIRTGGGPDTAEIARVHLATRRATYRGLLPDDVLGAMTPDSVENWWRAYLPRAPRPNTLLVAEDGGAAQGFAFLQRDGGRGEIFAIHVHPDTQGRGVGRLLMRHALDVLGRWGCDRAVLWVLAGNHGAQRFYGRLGWTPVPGGVRVENIDGARVDEVGFELSLAGGR